MRISSPVSAALLLLASLMLLGCGAGQSPLNLGMNVVVQAAQSAGSAFDAGPSVALNAVVQNDFSGRGVTWRLDCGGSACGTLNNISQTTAMYVPPSAPAGRFAVKVIATAVANGLITGSMTLTLADPVAITTTSLPVGEVGTGYATTLAATGGVQPYLWTVASGALPDGLILNDASGAITGTPTVAAKSDFVVQLTDFGGVKTTAALSITVQDVSVSITPWEADVLEPGQTLAFSAVVLKDPSASGVRWTIAGPTCTAVNCGTLTNVTALSTLYVAPLHLAENTAVSVTATSVADVMRSAVEHLIVVGPLSVTTAALQNGNVGVAYADRVLADGGIPAYSFDIAAGTLPPGLTLDSVTGAINGVPVVEGNYAFTLRVTDAGVAPFTQSATKNLTITVGNALPLVITTASLPDATINLSYALQLQAVGGLRPYRWSIFAGTLPSGLTLSSDGIIAGTPAAVGSYPITVQVMDSQATALSATRSFMLNVGYPHGPHDSDLIGHYAFLFNGFEDGGGAVAEIGSFTADGNGNITSGVMDANRTTGLTLGAQFAGRYLVGLDNRGEMTIQDAAGNATKFAFALSAANGASGIDGPATPAARFIEFDDAVGIAGTRGSGIMLLQDIGAFSTSAINGNYVLGLSGEMPARGGAAGPAAAVGVVNADGRGMFSNGIEDANLTNILSPRLAVAGSFTAPDRISGRATAVFRAAGGPVSLPQNYSVYVVNADESLVMSLDLRTNAALLSGEMRRQQSSAFTNVSLGSNFVIYENGVNPDSSNQPVAGQTNALVAVYSSDGNGNCTLQAMDQNAGGVTRTYEQSGQAAPLNCTVEPSGRSTLGTGQTMYLYAPGAGVYIENGLAALGHVEPQSVGPFTNASVPAAFFFGSLPPAATTASVASGAGTFEHQALFSPIVDTSTPTSLQPDTALFLPYVVDMYGRTILPDKQGGDTQGGIYVMYVISPTRMIWFDESTTNAAPSMEIVDGAQAP